MKSHIILGLLIFLISSCGGNPHIHSSRGGLERSNPPLISNQEEDGGCKAARNLMDHQFTFSSKDEGTAGQYPASFKKFTKCKSLIVETFNDYTPGFTYLISNRDKEEYHYELTHRSEKDFLDSKILTIEDIFSEETHPMEIETPVAQGGVIGKDQGIDAHSAHENSKTSLLWSFSAPIITWGLHVINLSSDPVHPAKVRLFDCDRVLIKDVAIIFPGNESGTGEKHFIGFAGGNGNVCHVSITASDDLKGLAVDELIYGK